MKTRVLFVITTAVALSACDKKPIAAESTPTPAAETTGERLKREASELAASAADATREATEKAKPALQQAGENLKNASGSAMESLKSAADATREKIHEATAPSSATPTATPTPTPAS